MSDLDLALCNVGLGSRSSPPPAAPDTARGWLRDWQHSGENYKNYKGYKAPKSSYFLVSLWLSPSISSHVHEHSSSPKPPFVYLHLQNEKWESEKNDNLDIFSSPRYRSILYWVKFVLHVPVATVAISQHGVWRRTELFLWVPLFSMSIILGLAGLWNRYWRTQMAILIYNTKFRS